MVILDTNIIIDHLRQPKGVATIFKQTLQEQRETVFGISIISIQELFEGKSMGVLEHLNFAEESIKGLEILPYTNEAAKLAGTLARLSNSSLDFADAAIAATAILNQSQLFTLNKKHFKQIKGLELI